MTDLLKEIEKWTAQYEFSFQFWGEGNNNVFICRGGVELTSFGGETTVEGIIKIALDWIAKSNPTDVVKNERDIRRCAGCGARIAAGNEYCGECLCEDDSDY